MNLNAVKVFLHYGACPNTSTNEGWSPLHQACWNFRRCQTEAEIKCNETIIRELLQPRIHADGRMPRGADPTSACYLEGDYCEYSALHMCALARHQEQCSEEIWRDICSVCHQHALQQPAADGVTPCQLVQRGQPHVAEEEEEEGDFQAREAMLDEFERVAVFDEADDAMEGLDMAALSNEADQMAFKYTRTSPLKGRQIQ